jgi:2-polyprenyl-3-methyl-5-hydroxy-6-metoxy-1,4-benzoquinol methylase
MKKEWFCDWFDSEYYHALYNNRNHTEAEAFIQNIASYLQINTTNTVLDIACGKGRHCMQLSTMAKDVTGIDLSKNSIDYANQFATEHLHFYVHDMRQKFRINYYDFVLNCFTSFGYFKNKYQNQQAANAIVANAKPGGMIVIDFLNSILVRNMIEAATFPVLETRGTATFEIYKKVDEHHIVKTIHLTDGDKKENYLEKVQALELKDFELFFTKAGASLVQVFGNYQLEEFQPNESPRLILVFKKNTVGI